MNVFLVKDLEERRSALGLRNEFQWSVDSIIATLTRNAQNAANYFGFGVMAADINEVFAQMASDAQTDPAAHIYTFLTWLPDLRGYLAGSSAVYSKPEANPTVFHNLTALKSLHTTNRISNMSDFAEEVESFTPLGLRYVLNGRGI